MYINQCFSTRILCNQSFKCSAKFCKILKKKEALLSLIYESSSFNLSLANGYHKTGLEALKLKWVEKIRVPQNII